MIFCFLDRNEPPNRKGKPEPLTGFRLVSSIWLIFLSDEIHNLTQKTKGRLICLDHQAGYILDSYIIGQFRLFLRIEFCVCLYLSVKI